MTFQSLLMHKSESSAFPLTLFSLCSPLLLHLLVHGILPHFLLYAFSPLCVFLSPPSSCRACGAGASSPSVQPLHPGVKPASSPLRRSGEERLAAKAHRGAGGGAQLPALSAGSLHRQHEGPRGWGIALRSYICKVSNWKNGMVLDDWFNFCMIKDQGQPTSFNTAVIDEWFWDDFQLSSD